jgi:hypothetical protein
MRETKNVWIWKGSEFAGARLFNIGHSWELWSPAVSAQQ